MVVGHCIIGVDVFACEQNFFRRHVGAMQAGVEVAVVSTVYAAASMLIRRREEGKTAVVMVGLKGLSLGVTGIGIGTVTHGDAHSDRDQDDGHSDCVAVAEGDEGLEVLTSLSAEIRDLSLYPSPLALVLYGATLAGAGASDKNSYTRNKERPSHDDDVKIKVKNDIDALLLRQMGVTSRLQEPFTATKIQVLPFFFLLFS